MKETEREACDQWWIGVIVSALGLAFVQPVVALLTNNPLVVVGPGQRRQALIVLAALAIVVPLVLSGLDMALRKTRTLSGRYRSIIATGLFGLTFARLGAELGITTRSLSLLLGFAAAAALTVGLFRSNNLRLFAALLVLVQPIALIGLASSDAGEVLRSGTPGTPEAPPVEPNEPASANARDQPPIVMLIVDELPTRSIINADGRIDADRFPNIGAFGDQATWYRRYTAVAPFTQQVVPSMLTGTEPTGEEALWVNYPNTLFSLLANDYHLVAGETVTKLCGLPVCRPWPPLPPPNAGEPAPTAEPDGTTSDEKLWSELIDLWWQGLRARDGSQVVLDDFVEEVAIVDPNTSVVAMPDDIDQEQIDIGRFLSSQTPVQPVRLTEFTSSFRSTDTPTLYFFHLVLPHHPYLFDANGTQYETATGEAEPFSVVNESPQLARVGERRHLEQAAYVDTLLGQIFAELRSAGIWDDAYIMLAADHGLDFAVGEHHREYSGEAVPGIAYSPLLIKEPNQTNGGIDDTNVLSYDLLPSLAAASGIEVPWELTGAPIGSTEQTERGDTKPFFVFTDPFSPRLRGIEEFSDRETFAQITRNPANQRSATSGVDRTVDDLVGQVFEPADIAPGRVVVQRRETFSDPESIPTGVISGWVEPDAAEAPGDAVVIAINDVVVAVAPLEALRSWDRFFAIDLLPIVEQPIGTVRVGIVGPDRRIVEIETAPG